MRFALALAFVVFSSAGCEAVCPPGFTRNGDRCVEPEEDSGVLDAAADATPDASPDACGGCVAGRFCFLGLCVPEDRCTDAIGVPCPAAGPQYLKSPQPVHDGLFGVTVATSTDGSTVAVGEPLASAPNGSGGQVAEVGAVHIFERIGSMLVHVTSVTPESPTVADNFGRTVALSGDGTTLAVGSAGDDGKSTSKGGGPSDNSVPGAGAVFMYRRIESEWAFEQYVKASDATVEAYFGFRVALDDTGSRLAVGARGRNGNRGAVYVFSHSGGGWSEDQIEQAPDGETNDEFGWWVTMSGDGRTFAVGAPFEDSSAEGVGGDRTDNDAASAGAAYVFRHTGTSWLFDEYIKAPASEQLAQFGRSVALNRDGTALVVGAPHEDGLVDGTATHGVGAAHVYSRSAAGWAIEETLRAATPRGSSDFGASVSLSADGNRLAVGSGGDDANATGIQTPHMGSRRPDAGAAFLFFRNQSGRFQQVARIKAPVLDDSDQFGGWVNLAGAGAWLIAGSAGEDSPTMDPTLNGLNRSGAAYMYRVGE